MQFIFIGQCCVKEEKKEDYLFSQIIKESFQTYEFLGSNVFEVAFE